MPDLSFLPDLLAWLPFESMQPRFMRQALLGILLLCPMAAMLGVQVLNFRMAFFSDAVGHSAFAGLAVGLLLGAPPRLSMLLFGVAVGLFVMAVQRKRGLSADAAIGIVFSAVVAFGLAVVSRAASLAREMEQFLYGDILTVSPGEIVVLFLLLCVLVIFQYFGSNRLLAIALSPLMSRVSGTKVAFWQYLFAAQLALVVMFSVRAVGVLLVTALLIVPAAAARNIARDMRGMFWWSIAISTASGYLGLWFSAQDWLATGSGATIILVACAFFAISPVVAFWGGQRFRKQ